KPDRELFRKIIGAVDTRQKVEALEFISTTAQPAKVAETKIFEVLAVRWPVFEGVHGEGLLLRPKRAPVAGIVAIPDADQTPEQLTAGLAKRLAENGCLVLIPTMVNREDTFSGNPVFKRFTNQPHREWIYRQAYELGRHIIGYEVQKVWAAIDWFERERTNSGAGSATPSAQGQLQIGAVGYGEGGLIVFYAAALDPRINA